MMKVNSHSVTGNSLESRVKCVCKDVPEDRDYANEQREGEP